MFFSGGMCIIFDFLHETYRNSVTIPLQISFKLIMIKVGVKFISMSIKLQNFYSSHHHYIVSPYRVIYIDDYYDDKLYSVVFDVCVCACVYVYC